MPRTVTQIQAEMQQLLTHQPPLSPAELSQRMQRLNDELIAATSNTPINDLVQGDKVEGDKVGRDKVDAENVNGFLITGDNNHVTHIIQQVKGMKEMSLTADQMREEIGRYLSWVSDRTGTIELRGIKREGQQVVQLDLETVYVPLSANRSWRSSRIQLDEILSLGNRLIITGGPGCGKTTVLTHIAWVLSQAIGRDDVTLAQKKLGLKPPQLPKGEPEKPLLLPIPIFVPLSAYAHYLRDLPRHPDPIQHTLAHFISRHLIEQQASFKLPAEFFIELLRQGQQVLLLLDGLDEVPDESERVLVREAIEQLVDGREQEQLRVVVTCRTAAYRERTALGRGFQAIQVESLAEEEVGQLVTQAYRAIYRSNPPLATSKAKELQESIGKLEVERRRRLGDKTDRLITSPLLVRMLLVVHYSERRLPDQRAELYMKATDAMLLPEHGFDAEVANRIGQLVGGSKERHRELVQYIAYEMHTKGDNKQGREIEEHDLKRLLQAQASYAPLTEDFLALTRLRGTLMEERLEMYRFIHLAFQEFLAARYLAETVRSEGGLLAVLQAMVLERRVLDSWWREPLLLTVGYLAVQSPHSAEKLVRHMAGLEPATAIDWPTYPAEWRWGLAELAGTVILEWPNVTNNLKKDVAQQIANLLISRIDTDNLSTNLWVNMGQLLDKIGDTRHGVGVKNDLPDIAWSDVVQVGEYAIGGNSRYDGKLQQIKVETEYHLAKYPITNIQFSAFVNAPDVYKADWWVSLPEHEKQFNGSLWSYGNHPCTNVSWYQAIAFCRWLSDKLEYEVRLPTEHEWEVAARYGYDNASKVYPWHSDEFNQTKTNTREGRVKQTTAVGVYPTGRQPALDLYDMSGNVFEWCQNKYHQPADTAVDGLDDGRVVRGGSWDNNQEDSRVSSRHSLLPHYSNSSVGFRVVTSTAL